MQTNFRYVMEALVQQVLNTCSAVCSLVEQYDIPVNIPSASIPASVINRGEHKQRLKRALDTAGISLIRTTEFVNADSGFVNMTCSLSNHTKEHIITVILSSPDTMRNVSLTVYFAAYFSQRGRVVFTENNMSHNKLDNSGLFIACNSYQMITNRNLLDGPITWTRKLKLWL